MSPTPTLLRTTARTLPLHHSRNTQRLTRRTFTTTPRLTRATHRKESFSSRLGTAWRRTPIKWRPIPLTLGIAFLGLFQFWRIQERERRKQEEEWLQEHHNGDEDANLSEELRRRKKEKKKERLKVSAPWTVKVMSTLPLKLLSRLWGRFNELTIPYYLRVPGFKLYGFIFGVDFSEIDEPDLHNFRNLAEFFYRTLKPGVRPLDGHPNALLSPADGRVIQYGYIEHGEVEQVKGVKYSLDALLGKGPTTASTHATPINSTNNHKISSSETSSHGQTTSPPHREGGDTSSNISSDEEFARVNGISYTLPNLFSGGSASPKVIRDREGSQIVPRDAPTPQPSDQSTTPGVGSEAEVSADLALSPTAPRPWYYPIAKQVPMGLYYCVVYLAPGDYHRFHSPASWVVESRRHFAGELYSVSPYLQRSLPGLFTLNERVCLLGKWRYGFFSMTPVGATNVGSIVINFDRELRTNSLLTDTLADLAAAQAQSRNEAYSGYAEATYSGSSPVLGGHALKRGEEMGGFMLGSTIVVVFEAPKGVRPSFDEGWLGHEGEERSGAGGDGVGVGGRKGGWRWCIEKGMRVKVGQRLGFVEEGENDDETM